MSAKASVKVSRKMNKSLGYNRILFSDFFILLDQECGPLTLHSSLKDLVNYTRKGLASISDDKKPSGVVGGLPPNAENFNHADQKISK